MRLLFFSPMAVYLEDHILFRMSVLDAGVSERMDWN